jgi:beta-galactosidase
MERPKVIYNPRTRQYVLFLHLDTQDYKTARVGIATSDAVTGPYAFRGSIAPHGSDSRDMTVFQDEDGQAYLLHSSEWNATLYIGQLSEDYLSTTSRFTRNFERAYREAPAVFKRQGKYYLLSSGCTGWDPNPAELAVAEDILGPWQVLGNPCAGPDAGITFYAQSTFVLPVVGKPDAYIAMFDIWKKEDLASSRYVWLPVRFEGQQVIIEWLDEWDLSVF